MDKPGELIIGAECGIQIGTGHVMRCLALAQSWKRAGGSAIFLLPEGSPGIEQRIRDDGFRLEALPCDGFADAVVNRMGNCKPRVAVLDGYSFGAREQAALSEAGISVLAVDDYGHASDYRVRWVLNQNAGARPEIYAGHAQGCRLLLGPSYALLRTEFLSWLGWWRAIPARATRILITIGGSDPDNLSLRMVEALIAGRLENIDVILAVGSNNPHLETLQLAAQRARTPLRIMHNPIDMPALMAWADIAVSGAGGTSYELCFMGLPSLLFVIAENQRGVAEQLSGLSAALHAGAASDFDAQKFCAELGALIDSKERRTALSIHARALVDGMGADRVSAALRDREMTLRPLRETDCELLFSWTNDPAVRSASFHSEPVAWEGHQRWFSQKLQDAQSLIYIAEKPSGEAVGQVRFHLDGDKAVVSIVAAPEFRGAGWGKELISFSIRELVRQHPVCRVDAFVKPVNLPSVRLFESAGFRREGSAQVAGQPALLFTWEVERPSCQA